MLTNLKIGWRNIGRNRKRTALSWGAIAIAQLALVWLSSFINGYTGLILGKLTGPMLGHIQLYAPKYRDDNAEERTIPHAASVIQDVEAKPHVSSVSARVYAPVLATAVTLGHVAMVTGLRAAGETGPDGILTSLPAESLPGPGEVLVGQGLAQEMGIHPGVTLALMGQAVDGSVASGLYRVKAIVTTVIDPINRLGIVMDLGTARDFLAMGDEVHELAVHVDTPRNIPGVLAGLKGDSLLSGLEVIDWKGLAPQLATLLQVTESVNLIIIVLLFVATVAGIANTMLMATFERSREMGMLLALGCRPRRLIGILFLEATVLGTTGVFIGSILGILIVAYQAAHGIDLSAMVGGRGSLTVEGLDLGGKLYPVLKVTDIARGVIAVIVTSILAVLWPARRVSRLEPMEAMRA